VDEEVRFHAATFTGDTSPVNPSVIGNPKVLVHDATYLDSKDLIADREHSTLREAITAAKEAGAHLVATHLSSRYNGITDLTKWKDERGVRFRQEELDAITFISGMQTLTIDE
jgi:ribonuclease BN (tRNA processing enzyme)